MTQGRILIVEDDESLRRITQMQLEEAGYDVTAAAGGAQALGLLEVGRFDLLLTDLRMEGMSGLELLRQVRSQVPDLVVILITAFGSIETAVQAMRSGAYDYITKPVHPEELRMAISRALEHVKVKRENVILRRSLDRKYGFESILGQSRSLLHTLDIAARAARVDATVLIQGETGTGKELLARAIHRNSARSDRPFVVINCGAIPRDLLESELFGHTRGAFTGAFTNHAGRVEQAEGGTLFLDEVGEMPLELQVKILRLAQQREIDKIGGRTSVVDVRIIAATHRNLAAMVEDGTFREDLYYRLAVIPVTMPSLRERPEDVAELVQYFFVRSCQKFGRPNLHLPCSLLPNFAGHHWPGNIRELESLMERLVVLATGDEITPRDLPETFLRERSPLEVIRLELPPEGIRMEAVEKELIVRALQRCEGNQTAAARYLDISRKTLLYRMEKHELPKDAGRLE